MFRHVRSQSIVNSMFLSKLLLLLDRYANCLTFRLMHIAPNDYEDFVSAVMSAKQTFAWAGSEGLHAFQHQLLNGIKRYIYRKVDGLSVHVFLID
jgi:hypothetical protein